MGEYEIGRDMQSMVNAINNLIEAMEDHEKRIGKLEESK